MEEIPLSEVGKIVEESDEFVKVRVPVWGEAPEFFWESEAILSFPKDQVKEI